MGSPAGPAIRVPPPVVFAGGWVAGWYLDRMLEFEIDGAGASVVQLAIGIAVIAAGLALLVWGFRTLVEARTTVRPDRASTTLVTNGPFRRTRNPIYLGLTVLYVGAAIVTNHAWPIVLLPIVLVVLTTAVVHREEAYLHQTFPEYEVYARRVRRWM